MSGDNEQDRYSKNLVEYLANMAPQKASIFPPQNTIRIQTRRGRRSSQFAIISKTNSDIVDELISITKKLANNGNGSEAAELITIIRKLLDNNHNLQQVVGEALLDIPN